MARADRSHRSVVRTQFTTLLSSFALLGACSTEHSPGDGDAVAAGSTSPTVTSKGAASAASGPGPATVTSAAGSVTPAPSGDRTASPSTNLPAVGVPDLEPEPGVAATGGAPSQEPDAVPGEPEADDVAPEPTGVTSDAGTMPEPGASPGEPGPVPAEPTTECEFEVTAELSETISTVGVVTFTTTLASVDVGQIEFGPDTNYGMVAPLDVAASDHRTLLLGMTADTTYHYRIVVRSGAETCVSDDHEVTTGPLDDAVQLPTSSAATSDRVTPGFLITSGQGGGGGGGTGSGTVVIFDKQGRPVWWHATGIGGVTRARMTWDGKYLYARDGNPSGNDMGQVVRISMDGLEAESVPVPYSHHDLAVTPDGGVLFFTSDGSDSCDNVTKLSTDGELTPIYDVRQAFGDTFNAGGNDPCHCNSIHYNEEDDSISFSCLSQNAYVKITAAGELVWVLGGNDGQSHFTGDGSEWERQHGHDFISPTRFVFFNNNGSGGGMQSDSLAVELELDLEAMTATRVWEYDGGNSSQTLGDVARLPNGNTLVTYSNAGVIHEVDADAELLQAWDFPSGIGYVEYRESLYGAPLYP